MAAPRFQLLRDGGIARCSKRSRLPLRLGRATMSPLLQQLDFVAAIFFLGHQLQCAWLGWARVLASAQGLQPARERKSNAAAGLSRDTSGKSWKDRGLPLDSIDAVAAARFPGVTWWSRRLFLREKVGGQLEVG